MSGEGNGSTWWDSEYWHFIKDTFWTICVFVIVAMAAFGLQFFIGILQKNGAKPIIIKTLTFAEYFVLFADTVYLVLGVGRHICLFAIGCWKQITKAGKS